MTNTDDGKQHTALRPDDLARVRRLTEEVKARLYEVGLIVGRTTGQSVVAGSAAYEPRAGTADDPTQTVDVVVVKLPDGTFCCSSDPPGECVCPC